MSDRHGRTAHGDNDRRRRPRGGFRLCSTRRFTDLVEDCLDALPRRLRRRGTAAHLRVVDVPGDPGAGDGIAVYDPRANALTVFRRAAELRADSGTELSEVVTLGVAAALGDASGFPVDDRGDPRPDRDD